jgi:methylenetetrahydrofolate reductase (NADPH)
MARPSISFEYFPPKTEEGAVALYAAVEQLMVYDPLYMTVTYGAGGSTKDGTRKALRHILKMTEIPLASHLTFLSTTKDELDAYIDDLWLMGIHHIVALRGDLPKGTSYDDYKTEQYYDYTSNFVAALKAKRPFEISVGAYPEKHPDAQSLDADIEALRLKCEAGADRAITQFFFENDVYYRFLDQCEKAGITTPVVPGLLPVHDFKGMANFAKRCAASVPDWLREKFEALEGRPEEAQKLATDLLISQAEDLAAQGVGHIHFYCMNKAPITSEAVEALGYMTKAA